MYKSKSSLAQLYREYGNYNILYNQLNLPSPSVDYAWRRTKLLLESEATAKITQLLTSSSEVSVCDLGCGNGALLIRLAQKFPQVKFVGFDLSQPFVTYGTQAAKFKQLSNISFHQLDIDAQPLPGTFDLVLTSEVLEHLVHPSQVLTKIYSALRPGGYLLLSTPNSRNLIKYPFLPLKKLLAAKQDQQLATQITRGEDKFIFAETEQHLHVFDHAELVKLLTQTGFHIYHIPRSTTFFGGSLLDNHLLFFSLVIFFDLFCNIFNLYPIGWDCIIFSHKP